MAENIVDLKVGDTLWYVPVDSRFPDPDGRLVKVDKVGRKFIYMDGMKSEYWNNNGYSVAQVIEWPFGTFYKSEDDYLAFKRWSTFQRDVRLLKLSQEQKNLILEIVGDLPQ